jgi:hypothetical protein
MQNPPVSNFRCPARGGKKKKRKKIICRIEKKKTWFLK